MLTLPVYSPELNPLEKLWDIIKDKVCTYCWESLENLEAAITEVLKEWWQRTKGFSSLFRYSYLRRGGSSETLLHCRYQLSEG